MNTPRSETPRALWAAPHLPAGPGICNARARSRPTDRQTTRGQTKIKKTNWCRRLLLGTWWILFLWSLWFLLSCGRLLFLGTRALAVPLLPWTWNAL